MRRADRRAAVAMLPDRGPGRDAVRRGFLRVRAVRRGLEAMPPTGTVGVAGPRAALLAAALRRTGPARGVEVVAVAGPWPPCDGVLLVDALAALPADAQERAVRAAVAALRPGGRIAVVEADATRRLRSALARARARRAGRGPVGPTRTPGAWRAVLEAAGAEPVATHGSRRFAPVDARAAVVAARGDGAAPGPGAAPRSSVPPAAPLGGRCAGCSGRRRRVALVHPEGTLVRCRGCGLVSVTPLPTPAAALAVYDAAYFRGAGYRDYAAEEAHFRATFRRRLRRLRAFTRPGQLFDVGAATGAFLLEARAAGFRVAGAEPADAVAAAARARGLDVRTGPLEAVEGEGVADVVTAFDVVEHLVDVRAGVARLARLVRPGGLVVVTVPDFGGWWARATGARWPFVTPREHLHYFTRRSLAALLRGAGLAVLEVGAAATPVSLGTVVERGLPAPLGGLARRLGRWADRGGALPFGTLFAVARRPAGGAAADVSRPAASRGSACR